VGAFDGWTLTDWFENVYLQVAGPERYDELARGSLAWTDPSVHQTLDLMGQLLAPDLLAGGPQGALETTFPESVTDVFGDDPAAAMMAGGDFVSGFIAASTPSEMGVDADAFAFPEHRRPGPLVVAGGDAVVALRRSPAADALVEFLASPEAGEIWAAMGGFISPNEDVSLEAYPDERTRTIARSLLEAGDRLRFDLSDLQPAEFGGTRGAGMLGILQEFLADPSQVERTARRLEAAAPG
jgi:alpha-glucoside transport system substrate-binding protein